MVWHVSAFFLLPEGAFQNHSRLRTPPLPLSHSHLPSHQHHAASINSLNRSNYTQRSNPSPAPTDSSVPPEGPASQDSVIVQDNWLLNSNIPLETRYLVICIADVVINAVDRTHLNRKLRAASKIQPQYTSICGDKVKITTVRCKPCIK